jgi:uncharacterized protein (DUF433 family)
MAIEDVLVQHIETTPGVLGGKPRLAGHRIRVMDVVVWHEKRGLSPDEIAELYPSITLADVHAALAYYFDHWEEIEAELQRETNIVAAMKVQYPSKLREKLGG